MTNEFLFTGMMNTALQFINSTGRHIFLTGKAGTGKTTFLKNLVLLTHKQIAIVAPTGIAALNAGGTTIHSQFLLPFGMFIPDRSYAEPPTNGANWYTETVLAKRHPLNSIRKQVLRSIDVLVIDEVSMLRSDLLDAIDYRLRSVRSNMRQHFGGVQLLLIGDLYQLPPVVKREEESRLRQYYNSAWFFDSKALQQDGFAYIELDKIFRQSDNKFIQILNNLRVNTPTREDIATLNEYFYPADEIRKIPDVITLTTHNYKADEMNTKALNELNSPSHFYNAVVKDDFPESMFPVLQRLELKVGAQIMFTRNDSEDGIYYNGKLATVTNINGDDVTVSLAGSAKPYTLRRSTWDNKKYHVNSETKELEEEVTGSFEQFPVRLAWAITVHKSQGLTFDRAIIDVGQAFADGQVYVALSRLRSIEGLILRTKVDFSVVTADKQIVSFDQQNNRPATLDSEMKMQQKEYLRRLVNKTFDFDSLVREITYIGRDDDNGEPRFEEKTMKPVLKQIKDAFVQEAGNTVRFRDQLKTLLDHGKHDEFLIRITKGREYYKNLLWQQVKILAQHAEDLRAEKRVKGYLNDLGDLDQLLSKKLEEVDKVFHLGEGILNEKEHFDFKSLKSERVEQRSKIFSDVVKVAEKPAKKKKRKKKSI
ncbi:MAG: AAA family ATPase [Bacteroidota bacterium]